MTRAVFYKCGAVTCLSVNTGYYILLGIEVVGETVCCNKWSYELSLETFWDHKQSELKLVHNMKM